MELYIRIKDGQPFEHPIFGDNFCQAFPNVDTNNLPAEFARFVRVEPPKLGPYEKNQTVSYQFVDGVWTDVFACEQMTDAEKIEKQNIVKAIWEQAKFDSCQYLSLSASHNSSFRCHLSCTGDHSATPITSWVFDEVTCSFVPPTPYPTDDKTYRWDEPTTSWVEVTNV